MELTKKQCEYLRFVIEKRIAEENFIIAGNGLNADYKDVSWRAGQVKAYKEILFVLDGLGGDKASAETLPEVGF